MKTLRIAIPALAIAAALFFILSAPPAPADSTAQTEKVQASGIYFDTLVQVTAYGAQQDALDKALLKCAQYEAIFSKTVPGSDVWRINHADGAAVAVCEDMRTVLETALAMSERTAGAFDISIAPSLALWDFYAANPTPPDDAALKEAAAKTDYRKIRLDDNSVMLEKGMMIDLGGVVKGYIVDKIAEYCKSTGIESAVLNFGGDVAVVGKKPDADAWVVGIQSPAEPYGAYMATIRLTQGAAVTSGIYERGFDYEGARYHHILDPETGWPADNTLASVTVIANDAMTADALSTACIVMGHARAMAFINGLPGVHALFVTKDGEISVSDGIIEEDAGRRAYRLAE